MIVKNERGFQDKFASPFSMQNGYLLWQPTARGSGGSGPKVEMSLPWSSLTLGFRREDTCLSGGRGQPVPTMPSTYTIQHSKEGSFAKVWGRMSHFQETVRTLA